MSASSGAGRLEELDERLQELARERRRQLRRAHSAADVTRAVWQVAEVIHWLAPPGSTAGLDFLSQQRPGAPGQRADWGRRLALATEAVADGDRARRATAPANETERRQLARARKFLAEASLHDWVAGLNTTQGIAPVSGVVLRELERRRSEEGAEALVQANSRRGQLQWLRRWRGRWRVSLARLQPGDRLPPEECARKAASLIYPGAERWQAFQQAPGRGALAEPPQAAGQPGVGRAVAGGAKQGVTMRAKKVPPSWPVATRGNQIRDPLFPAVETPRSL